MTPEIRAFEYALGLYSVLIGLAIADIAASFHRLARSGSPVKWHPLPVLAAAYAFCMAVGMWFEVWTIRNVVEARHYLFYLTMVGNFFVLFLIAAASLPDDPARDSDLEAYYQRNRRYFWSLVVLFEIVYIAQGVYFVHSIFSRMPTDVRVTFLSQWALLLFVPLAMAVSRSRPFHYLGFGILFAVQTWHYLAYAIN